jgi:ATP-dependent phosphofructokinase / diphosphate-dependent phosphofructokinase
VKKRIGILTGGGDVPGLNSVIKTVTYRSSENAIEVIGLRRGWEALTHLNLEDSNSRRRYLMPLDRENTRTIDRRGGTVLHSSRTNPAKMAKLPDHLADKDFPLSLGIDPATNRLYWDGKQAVLTDRVVTLGSFERFFVALAAIGIWGIFITDLLNWVSTFATPEGPPPFHRSIGQ